MNKVQKGYSVEIKAKDFDRLEDYETWVCGQLDYLQNLIAGIHEYEAALKKIASLQVSTTSVATPVVIAKESLKVVRLRRGKLYGNG